MEPAEAGNRQEGFDLRDFHGQQVGGDGRGRPSLHELLLLSSGATHPLDLPNIAAIPKTDNIFLSGKACTISFTYQTNPKVPFDRMFERPNNDSGGASSDGRRYERPERLLKDP